MFESFFRFVFWHEKWDRIVRPSRTRTLVAMRMSGCSWQLFTRQNLPLPNDYLATVDKLPDAPILTFDIIFYCVVVAIYVLHWSTFFATRTVMFGRFIFTSGSIFVCFAWEPLASH